MGAAVSMYQVSPLRSQSPPIRSQPKPSIVTTVPNRPTKKCHHLAILCRKCKTDLTIAYPLAVTFWKFDCTSCGMDYAIEIVSNRKCLVYHHAGRKTVERIGLTSERSSYYRAKCYTCGNTLISAQEELGQTKSCHHCRLDYTMHEVHNEVVYQTVVQHQGKPITFRDKVQALNGYIIHKHNMYFLDEDIVEGSPRALLESVSSLENENTLLRSQEESQKTTLLQMHAEKTNLVKQLKKQLDLSAGLTVRLQHIEKQTKTLELEKQTYAERMSGYGELVRDLDNKMEVSSRLELKVEALHKKILELSADKAKLLKQVAEQSGLVDYAKKAKSTIHELHQANHIVTEERKALRDHNKTLQERLASYADLLANLDRQSERAKKFESMYAQAATKAKKLIEENHNLANRMTGHNEVLQDLDQHMEKVAQLEKQNQSLNREIRTLQSKNNQFTEQINDGKNIAQALEHERRRVMELDNNNHELSRKAERLVAENRLLNNLLSENSNQINALQKKVHQASSSSRGQAQWESRINSLQQENNQLQTKLQTTLQTKRQEQNRLNQRIAELEKELAMPQQASSSSSRQNKREEPKEDWYCDEDEAFLLNSLEKGYQERKVLGLKGTPTPERIKIALRRRIKKYHPDMVASMGTELRELAHRKSQEITHAYAQLMRMYARG